MFYVFFQKLISIKFKITKKMEIENYLLVKQIQFEN